MSSSVCCVGQNCNHFLLAYIAECEIVSLDKEETMECVELFCFNFSRALLKIIHCSPFSLLKSVYMFLVISFTHLPFYPHLLSVFTDVATKSLIVPVFLTNPYISSDWLTLPFLCMSWKFTFCLSSWHLFHLSFPFLPLLCNIFSTANRPPPHVSSLTKFSKLHILNPFIQCHIVLPHGSLRILLRNPYSSTPHRIAGWKKERRSTGGKVPLTVWCHFSQIVAIVAWYLSTYQFL